MTAARRPYKRKTLADRFWPKVDKNGPVAPGMDTPCWVWTRAKNSNGYGVITRGGAGGGVTYAHRVAWELEHGPIPEGLCVLHHCDSPACVRHLFLGTMRDNTQDMLRKGRHSHGAAHGRILQEVAWQTRRAKTGATP